MRSERFTFPGHGGDALAARLDLPDGPIGAYALFAHCFTCGKDIFAATRISETLTGRGIGVLRFDFTGLGSSEGEFANTNFSSNIEDLLAAARQMAEGGRAPDLLIGHSLGGAAVIAAAAALPSVRAVVTIGAPADPGHVAHLFADTEDRILAEGEAEVSVGGRPFRVQRQFLEDVAEQPQVERIRTLKRPLLICHSPIDAIVGIENAQHIFVEAKHPKSFLSLDDADHLLSRRADAEYVAAVIASWAARFVCPDTAAAAGPAAVEGAVVVEETRRGKFQQAIRLGPHQLTADEPASFGGDDTGPNPYDLVLAGLGACTAMTLRLYADKKGIPLDRASVTLRHDKIHAQDCADCETRVGKVDVVERTIVLTGDLSADQRQNLLQIADRCPVHKTLEGEVKIRTDLKD